MAGDEGSGIAHDVRLGKPVDRSHLPDAESHIDCRGMQKNTLSPNTTHKTGTPLLSVTPFLIFS